MATKKRRESGFYKMSPVHSADILWDKKFRQNRSITHRFRDKCFFLKIANSTFLRYPVGQKF